MQKYFWETTVQLDYYSYYPSRSEFVSCDSVFAHWVMVLPETGAFYWKTQNEEGNLISGTANFGELFCTRPGLIFNRHVTTPFLEYHVFQWYFQDENGGNCPVALPHGKGTICDVSRLASTLEMAKSLFGASDAWSRSRQTHLLQEILHLLWQSHRKPAAISDSLMNEAAQMLRKRAHESFSMEEISSHYQLSAVQFTRRFRAAHGCNPIEYLTTMRLEAAQRWLIDSDLSLDEIAIRCGWASGAYLSHVFKRRMKTTPGNFRATHRL